ncbi:MAG: hypothetical protein GY720_05805 [bacterium]|nr:hypothetical protein [bacterium]
MKIRRGQIVKAALAGSVVLAVAMATLPVVADVGDSVLQGRINRVDRKTVLRGSAPNAPMLKIVNTAPDGIGIRVLVADGQAPLSVNSDALVRNLNADLIDGMSGGDLLPGGTLPAGGSIRGTYAMGGSAGTVGDLALSEISFGFTLSSPPTVHFVESGETPPSACPGSSTSPQAAPGHLCVYEAEVIAAGLRDTNAGGGDGTSYAFGARLFVRSAAAGDFYSMGTWAVAAAAIGADPAPTPKSSFVFGVAD